MDEAVIKQIQREGADPFQEIPAGAARDHEAALYVRSDSFCPDIFVDGDHQ